MKLNYKRQGQGESLIILHGFLGMLDNWQGQAKVLAEYLDVITVDLRNHGHSPHSDEHSYEVMMQDVLELMDDLGLESAHILGHSMGGKVAMTLAQQHPERVNKLVVVDIGPKYYAPHHQDIFAALRAVDLDALQRRSEAETYMLPHLDQPATRQFLMKSLYYAERNTFGWRFNIDALERHVEHVGEATDEMNYDGELLFIRGGASDYILDQDWPDIKVLFPHAYLETIDGAGHWVHAEKPREFIQVVLDYLKD